MDYPLNVCLRWGLSLFSLFVFATTVKKWLDSEFRAAIDWKHLFLFFT